MCAVHCDGPDSRDLLQSPTSPGVRKPATSITVVKSLGSSSGLFRPSRRACAPAHRHPRLDVYPGRLHVNSARASLPSKLYIELAPPAVDKRLSAKTAAAWPALWIVCLWRGTFPISLLLARAWHPESLAARKQFTLDVKDGCKVHRFRG